MFLYRRHQHALVKFFTFLGMLEFIYSFALCCVLSKTFILWIFDLAYKKPIGEVINSLNKIQEMCEDFTEHDRIRKWSTINNIFTAFYCLIVSLGYIVTPIKYWITGVW